MAIVEHRILEVLHTERVIHRVTRERLIKSVLKVQSEGKEAEILKISGFGEWEKIKERGYYFAESQQEIQD